jgi:hypothetical protein
MHIQCIYRNMQPICIISAKSMQHMYNNMEVIHNSMREYAVNMHEICTNMHKYEGICFENAPICVNMHEKCMKNA